jgi:hypothetical protein
MKIVLRPMASEREREAVSRALARLRPRGPGHPAYASRWRRPPPETEREVYAGARPRRSPGATRA